MHATVTLPAPGAKRFTLLALAAVLSYLALATLQNFLIQERVGLALSPWQVFRSTVKLLVRAGPWVPFLMAPPSVT